MKTAEHPPTNETPASVSGGDLPPVANLRREPGPVLENLARLEESGGWRNIPSIPAFAVTVSGELWRIQPALRGPTAGVWPLPVSVLPTPRGGYVRLGFGTRSRVWTGFVWKLVAEAYLGIPLREPFLPAFRDGNANNAAPSNILDRTELPRPPIIEPGWDAHLLEPDADES